MSNLGIFCIGLPISTLTVAEVEVGTIFGCNRDIFGVVIHIFGCNLVIFLTRKIEGCGAGLGIFEIGGTWTVEGGGTEAVEGAIILICGSDERLKIGAGFVLEVVGVVETAEAGT